MKRSLAIFLSFAIIISAFVFSPAVSAETVEQSADLSYEEYEEYAWSGTSQVIASSKQARYFRTKVLSDGSVGAVYYRGGYGNYFAKSTDGGLTFTGEVALLKNATDSQIANSPFVTEENPYGRGRLEAQNPNLLEMPNGDIMVFHRYNTYTGSPSEKPWSFYYSSICYQISSDGGKTWTNPEIIVECTKEKALNASSSDYGFWEPDPYIINGKLFVYYADTYTPNNLSYQNIMYCVWDEETKTFSAPKVAQNGTEHQSRDGMSVVTQLSDGNYAMVFESTKTGNSDNTFVIKMSLSKDGMNWSRPMIVASPNKVLSSTAASSSEKAVCASPHIITLPDGRVAISYQTTDRYSGVIPDRVSYRVGTQVAVSKVPITYDEFADKDAFNDNTSNVNITEYFCELADGPDTLADGGFSKSASLLYRDGHLMVYYNVGTNTDAYTHSIGAVKVSYAKIGVSKDYGSLENYTAFNKNNSDLTNQNASFTIPSSTSTMLVTDNTVSVPLADLYNSANYRLYSGGGYSATFNSQKQTITTSSTGKALIKNTENMTTFTASMKIKGSTSTGTMQGGFAFHLQENDFNTNYFNTSGYSVFVRRTTSDLSKAEIVYRYCSNGQSVYSYVAGSYKGLPTDKLDLEFELRLIVNKDKFYAQLLDSDGNVIISSKEAPLNELASGKDTDYYPVGSLAIINHGAHTFRDVKVTKTAELVKSDYIKARGIFTTSLSGDNQIGFALRAQGSVNGSPGYSGYVVKLVKTNSTSAGTITLQLTRYGTDASGTKYKNLGNVKTYSDTVVLNGASASGASVIMEAEAEDNLLKVTLTNPERRELSSTYTFDLTAASTASSVKYSDYYSYGGFGVFNHGSSATSVRELDFWTEKSNRNNINSDNFAIYQPSGNSLKYTDNSFISTANSGKKMMFKDTFAADFTADATFEIGCDGTMTSGIIFRAQSIGNATNDMEGYSLVVTKGGATANKSRMMISVLKWVRKANGELDYYKNIKGFYDNDSLKSVIPETETSMIASSGVRVRINLSVIGNDVTATFDILGDDGNVLKTSATLSYDLSKELKLTANYADFTYDGINTLFGAGQIGLSMNKRERLCDFNFTSLDTDELEQNVITTQSNHNGFAYTTLCSGAASEGSLVKVVPVANEGSRISFVEVTVGGQTTELQPTNGEYSFTKAFGATTISAVFKKNGDIDGNDEINALDLSSMRKGLIGKSSLRTTDGDVNQNGIVDLKDLVKLKKLIAGI